MYTRKKCVKWRNLIMSGTVILKKTNPYKEEYEALNISNPYHR